MYFNRIDCIFHRMYYIRVWSQRFLKAEIQTFREKTNMPHIQESLTSCCSKFSNLSACTNCSRYSNNFSSDDSCSRSMAYQRKAGCVKSGLNKANASLPFIGSHCSNSVSACLASVAVSQLIQRKKTTSAWRSVLRWKRNFQIKSCSSLVGM